MVRGFPQAREVCPWTWAPLPVLPGGKARSAGSGPHTRGPLPWPRQDFAPASGSIALGSRSGCLSERLPLATRMRAVARV